MKKLQFKVGDFVAVNTTRFDDFSSIEYGARGVVTSILQDNIRVKFPLGSFKGQVWETWGEYDPSDLRPLTRLEKALK